MEEDIHKSELVTVTARERNDGGCLVTSRCVNDRWIFLVPEDKDQD